MTQGDEDEATNLEENQVKKDQNKKELSLKVDSRFSNYEILLNIENEDQIKVPKGK